jgi:hypothetical protein
LTVVPIDGINEWCPVSIELLDAELHIERKLPSDSLRTLSGLPGETKEAEEDS